MPLEPLPCPLSLRKVAMLPAEHRLHRRQDFTEVVGRGRRAGRRLLVVHLAVAGDAVPRAGLVVSKAVGNAVVRHRVSRRLRHLLRGRLEAAPAGTRVVVRATPAAATATSEALGRDLDSALLRLGVSA